MNPSHYPSVSLCIRATKLGFPKTKKFYITKDNINFFIQEGGPIMCPSKEEILQYLPKKTSEGTLCIYGDHAFYKKGDYEFTICPYKNLADSLLNLWIWCKENGYIK